MEPTIYKPSIYNGNGIYKNGATGGGGGGVEGVEILGNLYKTKKIGNYEITLNCFWSSDPSRIIANLSTLFYRGQEVQAMNTALAGTGWHVPTKAEITTFRTYCNDNGIILLNELKLPNIFYNNSGTIQYQTVLPALPAGGQVWFIGCEANTNTIGYSGSYNNYYATRLFRD